MTEKKEKERRQMKRTPIIAYEDLKEIQRKMVKSKLEVALLLIEGASSLSTKYNLLPDYSCQRLRSVISDLKDSRRML